MCGPRATRCKDPARRCRDAGGRVRTASRVSLSTRAALPRVALGKRCWVRATSAAVSLLWRGLHSQGAGLVCALRFTRGMSKAAFWLLWAAPLVLAWDLFGYLPVAGSVPRLRAR